MPVDSNAIRRGVVGCGQIAVDKSIHGVPAAKDARLLAIADPLAPRRALALGLAAKAGCTMVKAYPDDAELFANSKADAVYIPLYLPACKGRRRYSRGAHPTLR